MEASALHAPAGVSRLRNTAGASFLRLRSDDQLVELFRDGHEEAFRVIHDRYRARLFAYMRQMLSGSRQDAEDALQDVFIRAYSGLRANDRHLALRAWLYRVAHNRCVDQLRKNMPILTEEIEATSQDVSTDPQAAVQQREDLRKLITDVQRLPEQQRSALLMREMSGMTYQELADSLDLSIPAIKSLLVRARVGLAAAAEARDTDCSQIRTEIVDSHERGARPSALTRRHLSDCAACREYRESVRGMSKTLAALVPAGPLILAAKLLGLGSAYSAAAYSSGAGGAAAGGAAATAAGGAAATAAGGATAGGAATAASVTAASVSAASAGAAVAGGAAAAGSAAAGGAVVAGGVSAAHVAAIIAAAAAAGGAVAVTDQSSHHAAAPLHPASHVIRQAVESGVSHGYAPAAAAPVAPVTPVTPASAPASNAAATIAKAVATKLKHQESTPAVGTTAPSVTSTTAASTVAGPTATTPIGTPTTAGASATGGAGLTTATTASSASPAGFASGTSTTPAYSSTVATTPSASATTPAGTSAPTDTTSARSDSTSSSGATTAGSSTTPSATASPTTTSASSTPPAG